VLLGGVRERGRKGWREGGRKGSGAVAPLQQQQQQQQQ